MARCSSEGGEEPRFVSNYAKDRDEEEGFPIHEIVTFARRQDRLQTMMRKNVVCALYDQSDETVTTVISGGYNSLEDDESAYNSDQESCVDGYVSVSSLSTTVFDSERETRKKIKSLQKKIFDLYEKAFDEAAEEGVDVSMEMELLYQMRVKEGIVPSSQEEESSEDERVRARRRERRDKKKKKKKKRRKHRKRRHDSSDDDDDDDDSTSNSEYEDRRSRKQSKKKKKKRSRQKARKRRRESDSDDDEESGARRSVITGKKIKMHIEKTEDDVAQEAARKNLLKFMNSSVP